jgi:hypothetical protein
LGKVFFYVAMLELRLLKLGRASIKNLPEDKKPIFQTPRTDLHFSRKRANKQLLKDVSI